MCDQPGRRRTFVGPSSDAVWYGMVRSKKLIAEVADRLRPVMKFAPIEDRASYSIGRMASHLRVSLRTLRFYEQAGLMAPDRDGLRRLYSRDDLERLEVIVTLRELEVSLTSIRTLMALVDADAGTPEGAVQEQADVILADLAADNRARIAELEAINERIATARTNLSGL